VTAGTRVFTGAKAAPVGETHRMAERRSADELVKVAGAQNESEAELIQNLLRAAGVVSIVRRSAGADVPDFLAAGRRDVLVARSVADIARDALTPAEPL
jgi:hypothetical protein